MNTSPTAEFEKWLAAYSEQQLLETLNEYVRLANEYSDRAEETRALIQLRRRLGAEEERKPTKSRAARDPDADLDLDLFPLVGGRRPPMADALIQVVAEADNPVSARAILAMLDQRGWVPGGKTPLNSVHATASRLVKAGRLLRTGKGYVIPPATESE